jgi:hypothetical protein
MSRSNYVLGAMTVITGVVSVVLWQQLRDERAAKTESQETTREILSTPPLQQSADDTDGQVMAPVGTAPPVLAPTDAVPVIDHTAATADERVRDNLHRIKKANIEAYPDLARELGLTAQEAESLAALRRQHELALFLRSPPNVPALSPEAALANTELERKQKEELRARLGAKYPQWEQYLTTVKARRGVYEIRAMLPANMALTDYQSAQLLTTLIVESTNREDAKRLSIPATADPRSQLENAEQDFRDREESNRRFFNSARSYLSAEQMTWLQNAMADMSTRTQAQLEARRQRLENGGF